MSAKFCRDVCGTCDACIEARAEIDREMAIYDTLSDEDVNSLHGKDPDDPRNFALDHKGRP